MASRQKLHDPRSPNQPKRSQDLLSSKQLARAIGVSESSIKRWVDDGVVRATRTAGGHRRIPLPEAVRFIRTTKTPVLAPELLGLRDLATMRRAAIGGTIDVERLTGWLAAGAAAEARGLVLSLYLRGTPAAAIVDGPVRTALARLGELWRSDPEGIIVEHRATAICLRALDQLGAVLPEPAADAPLAVGAAPARDPYLLPTLAAAVTLAAEGYRVVNLGPDLPLVSLQLAVARERPALVWVSVSVAAEPAALARDLNAVATAAHAGGGTVVAGGRALGATRIASRDGLHVGESLAELAAFARGLRVAKGV